MKKIKKTKQNTNLDEITKKPVFKKKKTEKKIKNDISKVGDCSQGRPEGSLFNSYYTEV